MTYDQPTAGGAGLTKPPVTLKVAINALKTASPCLSALSMREMKGFNTHLEHLAEIALIDVSGNVRDL